ncbi:TetR family transcriptional regulator [Agromyces bauzanensis]
MSAEITSPKRAYRSELRARQAGETRQAVLDAAARLFAEHGYGSTSLADIARAAEVSVETVKLMGPKRELLLAAHEQAFAGTEGQESMLTREATRAVLAITDNTAFLEATVDLLANSLAASARLWRAFTSAADADPAIAASLAALVERRRADTRAAIEIFGERGMLEPGADREALTDIFVYVVAPEGYMHFVGASGWSTEAYRAWVLQAMRSFIVRGA